MAKTKPPGQAEKPEEQQEITLLVSGLLSALGSASAVALKAGRHGDHAAIENVIHAAYALKTQSAALHCLDKETADALSRVISAL